MSFSAPNSELNAAARTRTALVVDDVKDMLDLLEIALNCAQFSVLRANSVADALDLFQNRSQDIDLLMTEVRLGHENGLELAKRLRASKPSLQILAISGSSRDRKSVPAQNGIAFLSKPFSASELRVQLDSLFSGG